MHEKILEAFGEVSALFMSQGDTPAGKIITPHEELIRSDNQLETDLCSSSGSVNN